MASLILTSCADQSEPVQDTSNFVRTDTKTHANLAVLKPSAPKEGSEAENKVSTLSKVTEGTDKPVAQTLPPAPVLENPSSSLPAPDISELIGLNGIGLKRLLGKPLLVRREAEAEVWQYSAANCVLHLFLYRDAVNKFHYRVIHMEANHRKRINTVRASVDLNSLEQKKL